ncbi:MAG: hypothetical protein Q9162_006157 [Coniocarpon cinnabarinum]
MLDPSTEVGIIELRTCIQAIINASPELVAKLGQDFTIYAYDYSEYETPLVGQGMLSWALAAASATPTAPAQQSLTPVTGRVTRGGLNLFQTNSTAETLEVKLKLVPVPTSLQNDYMESMQKYRDTSNFSTQSGDAAAWSNLLMTNPSPAMPSPTMNYPQPSQGVAGNPNPPSSIVDTQFPTNHFEQSFANQSNQFRPVNASASRPTSRPATPKGQRTGQQSRQSSRASSTRSRPKLKQTASAPQVESALPVEANDFVSEQPRKRARVEQTSWKGRSALQTTTDSLRVAASTAASIRGHALPAANTAAAQIAANEAPARPPTPRPSASGALKRTNTSLADDAVMHRPRQPSGLVGISDALTDNEASMASSPESQFDSVGSTPLDIPSSPPLVGQMPFVEASSPVLPRSADFVDSGFGSGGFDDLFDDKIPDEDPTARGEIQAMPSTNVNAVQAETMLTSELSITEEVPGDPSLLPQKTFLTKRPPQPKTGKRDTKRRAASTAVSSPQLGPQTSHSSEEPVGDVPESAAFDEDYAPAKPLCEDFVAPQIPGLPSIAPRPHVDRRDSCASLPSLMLDARESQEDFQSNADIRSGVKRRHAIKVRLEADLAAGKLPQHCGNCGEIETPTWRKCFIRNMQGPPPEFTPHAGEESYLGNEVTERDEANQPVAYRVIRRSIARGEKGWEEMKLCNSCGIWLFKMRSMRPPEKWAKAPKNESQSKKKPAREKNTPSGDPQSDTGSPMDNEADTPFETELQQLESEPFRPGGANTDYDARNGSGPRERSAEPELPRRRSEEAAQSLNDAAAAAALERAIKSSPPRFPGSQAAPIDLEEASTNPPVNRLLFPSPRKDGQMKTLDGCNAGQNGSVTVTVSTAEQSSGDNKENLPSLKNSTATTPTKKQEHSNDVFKMPKRRAAGHNGLTPGNISPGGTKLRRSPRFSPSKTKEPANNSTTPFTASMNQMFSDPLQSPTNFSDQFNMFSDAAFGEASNTFNFNDFTNDGYAADMPLPQSDADYFPVLNDFDMSGEPWNGGPLFDGELDALLQEAGENGCEKYFAATGIAGEQVAEPTAPEGPKNHDASAADGS